jgi:hypothetical protein
MLENYKLNKARAKINILTRKLDKQIKLRNKLILVIRERYNLDPLPTPPMNKVPDKIPDLKDEAAWER